MFGSVVLLLVNVLNATLAPKIMLSLCRMLTGSILSLACLELHLVLPDRDACNSLFTAHKLLLHAAFLPVCFPFACDTHPF